MSERCERTSERTSKWPSTYVSILVCSRPQWNEEAGREEEKQEEEKEEVVAKKGH